jgi:hypothetical protein
MMIRTTKTSVSVKALRDCGKVSRFLIVSSWSTKTAINI